MKTDELSETLENTGPLQRAARIHDLAMSPSARDRARLAQALAEIEARFCVPTALAVLARDEAPTVREEAVRAAGARFPAWPSHYRSILNHARRDPDPRVRRAASAAHRAATEGA